MPYKPNAPTDAELSNIFYSAWVGLAANAALLVSYALSLGQNIVGPALAITGAMIFVTLFTNRYDDYFDALRNNGLRWGMGVIALYLFAGAMMSFAAGGNIVGFWAASGEMPDLGRERPGFMADGFLLAILTGFAYHIGFAVARIRGTRGA